MKVFVEETDGVPLRLLERSLLRRVVGVTTRREAVRHTREVDVLPRNIQLRQLCQSVLFQLLGECEVVLRSDDLDGDLCGVDLGLLEE